MRIQLAFATSTALVLALSACGGPPESDTVGEDLSASEVTEVEVDEPTGAGDDAEASDVGEAEGEGAGEASADDASPAPTPSASATPTPTATPSQIAAATPPASFTTCGVCHSVEPGQNMIGPSLAGVVGRRAGTVAGANYSPAMKSANITWTEANLRRYIADPAAVVPGGTMPNPGVSAADTQAIVNYLKTL